MFRFSTPNDPITSVSVQSSSQKITKRLVGTLQKMAPPSTTVTLSGLGPVGVASATRAAQGTSVPPEGSFVLAPSVQLGDGSVRSLCEVTVPFRSTEMVETVVRRARDAINLNLRCALSGVSASVQGLASRRRREDEPVSRPRLELSAPRLTGVQLITSVRTDPGRATELMFDLGSIGVPVRNALMPMRLDFTTSTGGARGGEILIEERSPLGGCAITVPISRGASARELAAAVAGAFQARGIPGPHPGCPANRNPRDVVADGNGVTVVLASQLVVSVKDAGVGFTLQPQGLIQRR